MVQRLISRLLQRRIVRAALLYSDRRGSALADSITYRALFSVFAAVLLGFSLAALWLGGNPEAMAALTRSLDQMVPGLLDLVDPSEIEAPAGFTIVGVVSLIGLVSAAIGAVGSLRGAYHQLAGRTRESGFFLWAILKDLLTAIILGALLGLSAALSLGRGVVMGWMSERWGLAEGSPALSATGTGLGLLSVFLIDVIALVIMYRLLSGQRPPAGSLWGGAAIGALGLTVLQMASGLFVQGAASNPLLASFAALIALLLWFNLSAQVILLAGCYSILGEREARDRTSAGSESQTIAQLRRVRAEEEFAAAELELREAREAEHSELEQIRTSADRESTS